MAGQDRKRGAASRDRVTGPELPIPHQVCDAVERSAALRRGLALLHKAPAEIVAAAIGVNALAVEEARHRLEQPGDRRLLLDLFARALEQRGAGAPTATPSPSRPRDPQDLIREAERGHHGLDFLRGAHPETVAITFAVHPELVHRARELLATRGHLPGAGEDA